MTVSSADSEAPTVVARIHSGKINCYGIDATRCEHVPFKANNLDLIDDSSTRWATLLRFHLEATS
jgi:hypothetical protein